MGDLLPQEWEKKFDVVISLEVVGHLFDPTQLVKATDFTLKDDGLVIIPTPYHGHVKNLALALAG